MPFGATRCRTTLLDTTDPYDAYLTGRRAPEDHHDGMGLLIAYDDTGSVPMLTVDGPDGAIELRGIEEIRAANGAMRRGAEMAERFIYPRNPLQWRPAHAQ